MPNKQKSFQNPKHRSNYHPMTIFNDLSTVLNGGREKEDFLGKKQTWSRSRLSWSVTSGLLWGFLLSELTSMLSLSLCRMACNSFRL
jgi:hypothetical protein